MHVIALAPVQTPARQVSVLVQALPSLQRAPFGFSGFEHEPVAGLQAPALWQVSCATQTTGFPPLHVPTWQVSVCVQPLPSSHVLPSGFAGLEQTPVAELQVPTSWHASEAVHTTGLPPVQTPAWHVSVFVQASPSLHAVPVSRAHVPFEGAPATTEQASQAPALQALSQQTPSTQKPLMHSLAKTHAVPLPAGAMGSKSWVVAKKLPPSVPPATSTFPFWSDVAVKSWRATFMGTVVVQVFTFGS